MADELFLDYVVATDYEEQKADTPGSEQFASFEEYRRRELPRIARRIVEQGVQMETEPIKERMQAKLLELMPECMEQLVKGYIQSQRSLPSTLPNESNTPFGTAMHPLQPSQSGVAGERLASFYVPPPPVTDPQPFMDMGNTHQKSLHPNVFSD